MAKPLVSDGLWAVVAPLLPPHRPRDPRKPGRRRVPDRACLTGIVFVLKTGIQWEYLPQELGCGSGMTCWRRLRDWQRAGVWRGLNRVLLHRLADAGKIDWSRASADAARPPARRVRRSAAGPERTRVRVCPNVCPNAGESRRDSAPGRGRRAGGRRRAREATGGRGSPGGQFVISRPSVRTRPSAPETEAPSAGVRRGLFGAV
jgi:transposase